ncbi:protein kinase [Paenibacillus peoriae]|uniref:Protein kinase n=1 Tax=Paenibacillus peoriae TaxID=59893 RepID=A0A7H0Y2N5_9BACL|nr:protein kinase [Paenibacillus peoriae]QNR65343.1 protein kinase [Paenibacillus peoriae]
MSLKNYNVDTKKLGGGGNGDVYRATDRSQKEIAIKIFQFNKPKKETSFKDKIIMTRLRRFEIEAQKGYDLSQKGQRGIIPIIHYELPCPDTGKYFYVMPIATPLEIITKKINNIYELIHIFKYLAQVLSELHAQGISHRDIKPDNILFYNGTYCFSDLGLIDFPEKEDLTRVGETLGNRKTMAPEMRTPNEEVDHRPADVYSFAKTLWMVLAKEKFAFDGQFNPFQNQKLQKRHPKQHLVELHELLHDSTFEDPTKRPTMEAFIDRIKLWEQIAQNEISASESSWRYIERSVIDQFSPSTVMWRDEDKVIEILNKLAVLNFNHTFIHDGGGMDLLKIEKFPFPQEPNMIMLSFGLGTEPHLFKLKRLVWELPNNDPRFSYFRLEFDTLKPIYPAAVRYVEEWSEKIFHDYEKECCESLNINAKGEYDYYNPEDEDAQQVIRWFNGVFLIVYKGAVYNNEVNMTYDGRHARFSTDDFREYMEMLQSVYTHPVLQNHFRTIAEEDPHEENYLEELREILTMNKTDLKQFLNYSD